jgi:ADP-ribose pyrophosphatase YjhB (NUDIX family)
MGFTDNLYERERFEEVLRVAADIRAAALEEAEAGAEFAAWSGDIGSGVAGYVTPKTAVGAVVGNERGEILLGQRSDSGEWFYPVGWADVGYSPAEVAVKEVFEETGIVTEPLRLIAVFDAMRLGLSSVSFYSLVFHCRMTGGELVRHPLESLDVGWFGRDALPAPLRLGGDWVRLAFDAIDGVAAPCYFDPPRLPLWRTPPDA